METLQAFCNRVISYSFYALFLLVPLFFTNSTSELFEFNKMWLTFGLTLIIATAWIIKMILKREFRVQKTPLDLPLLIFLLANILSTIFSLDTRISIWGYYSRFNGGLLSILSYVFLYYAFVSNLGLKETKRVLQISLITGLLVVLWGIPSHFGYDPTCFIFRGSLDVSCWTEAFKPTVRIFSTLGQPAWLAAYVALLLPISLAFLLNANTMHFKRKKLLPLFTYGILSLLFYLALLLTDTRAGFIAFWLANGIFWLVVLKKQFLPKKQFLLSFLLLNFSFLLLNFTFRTPISQLNNFNYQAVIQRLSPKPTPQIANQAKQPAPVAGELGGTDSGKIRLYVWEGAIDAWKANPLIGTGVETFAFAYYKYRPAGHNMTSEWDYLYNKAHNEYLNYLTTTGIIGLGAYLSLIGLFIFVTGKSLLFSADKSQPEKNKPLLLTITGLFTGYLTILISNFFGFSVVIINLYFFLIPAFVFILGSLLTPEKAFVFPSRKSDLNKGREISPFQWTSIIFLLLTSCFLLLTLLRFWYADKSYALGHNLSQAGQYQQGYPFLQDAVTMRPNEPVFSDELALSSAALAYAWAAQKDATQAAQFANQAIRLSDQVILAHPNNIVYWKDRVRIMFTLSQLNTTYSSQALEAIQKARSLAPTDAKIAYNLGVLYGRTGETKKGIDELNQAIKLKPDYRDAYYALALFYHQMATGNSKFIKDPVYAQKAVQTLNYILTRLNRDDKPAQALLNSWQK